MTKRRTLSRRDALRVGSAAGVASVLGACPSVAQAAWPAKPIKVVVPYAAGGGAMTGLVSKQIDVLVVSTPSALGQIKGGRVRALAVSGDTRVGSLPDVPTFKEAALPGFGVVNWNGIAAPAALPADIATKLRAEIIKALDAPEMREFLTTMSAAPGGIEAAAFAKLIADETALWAPVAAKAEIEKQ